MMSLSSESPDANHRKEWLELATKIFRLPAGRFPGGSGILLGMKRICWSLIPVILAAGTIWFFQACGRSKNKNEAAVQYVRTTTAGKTDTDDRQVIVAFGDSLTAGAGVEITRNYPSQLQNKINAEGYRYRVVNAGVSGDTSGQGLNRIHDILDLKPSIVIVELGANDGLRGVSVSTTRRNLDSIVIGLKSVNAKVILAGMRVPPNYGPQYTETFRAIFEDVAEHHGIPLIPFFLEGVGGIAALNQDDGIHPTAEGYEIVVENVWRVLQPLLWRTAAAQE